MNDVLCICCRECGALTTMEHADQHEGLCTRCVHPLKRPSLPMPFDHDEAQPTGGDDDPIRRAIDRACFELFNRRP
jgi:hypothetical protein